jgi:NDP-sugar pyrophosphorylase family protein
MQAMILAAGTGTRLGPITDSRPKALVEIDGVSLLEINIERLIRSGFTDIVINLHHFAGQIIDFLQKRQNFGANIRLSDETGLLVDTGGALKKAAGLFDPEHPVLVHNVDILTNLDLISLYHFHLQSSALATLAVMDRPTTRHLLIDGTNRLCGWQYPDRNLTISTRETIKGLKKSAFSGVYMLSGEIFSKFPDHEVFGFIPWILELAGSEPVMTWDQAPAFWYEAGRPESLEKARKELLVDRNHPDFISRK